ncbi:MAG: TrmH family RNA methyltransferase [Chloroflexota bacterium]
MQITSTRNPLVKYVRSLERTREREREGVFLAEGVRLVSEAVATEQQPTLVLYSADRLASSQRGEELMAALPEWASRLYEVSEPVLTAAAPTEHPAGILAVLRKTVPPPLNPSLGFGLILDGLADPGNAGTILRTADAAGAGYAVTLPGSIDLYNPKVVRAGMGAHFRLPLYRDVPFVDLAAALPDVALVALEAAAPASVYTFAWPRHGALVVGSEARGLSPRVANAVRYHVRIPMRNGVESLNAAVAAAIALYSALGSSIE